MTLRISLLLILLTHTAYSAPHIIAQDTVYGKVVSIADGETFTMLLDNKTTIKVRLISIDCPERKQPYSNVAMQFLSDAIFGKEVIIGSVFHNHKPTPPISTYFIRFFC
jgi:endonuclease YncB( thermonuclease family)